MLRIESWSRLPQALRDHLIERMRDREISLDDLNQLRLWTESKPIVPEGPWYKDFGSFKTALEFPWNLSKENSNISIWAHRSQLSCKNIRTRRRWTFGSRSAILQVRIKPKWGTIANQTNSY
jgi:hypothetical protein